MYHSFDIEKGRTVVTSAKKQARLVERGRNGRNGGAYEIWDVGNDTGVFVDFNPCPWDTGIPETMAFPMDLRDNAVTSWVELGVWYEDATGGKAIRELGYEPIGEGAAKLRLAGENA